MSVTINGSSGLTFNDASTQNTAATGFGFKNRIINGAMMIDQRNAGASVTISDSGAGQYTLDRWRFYENTDGVITSQQSSVAPAGFTNSLLVTVTTTDSSIGAGQIAILEQKIEGLNVSDLGWGTADAQPVTLSFKVRSSVTGTFGGSLRNSADTRSYPFSYTISSANTWTNISVTVVGDTTGTWLTTNGVGLIVTFGLSVGSNFVGTANSWASANYQSATGQTNLLGTSGATFYITGVQLEKGSTATSFDYRPYGTELALCQRYTWVINANYYSRRLIFGTGSNGSIWNPQFPVTMRTTPSLITKNFNSTNVEGYNYSSGSAIGSFSSITAAEGDTSGIQIDLSWASGISSGQVASWRWVGTPTAYVGFSAEL
jgi:hypothetical protein